MDNFNFLKSLVKSESSDVLYEIFKSLSNEGLEVYICINESYVLLTEDNVHENYDVLYVTEADYNFAKSLVENLGYKDNLAEIEVKRTMDSELDVAYDKYYKKRKWTYIEAVVIIILGIIFYLYKIFSI